MTPLILVIVERSTLSPSCLSLCAAPKTLYKVSSRSSGDTASTCGGTPGAGQHGRVISPNVQRGWRCQHLHAHSTQTKDTHGRTCHGIVGLAGTYYAVERAGPAVHAAQKNLCVVVTTPALH